MSDKPSALQQRFEREFDEERFREQLNWLIENRPVSKNGRVVKRTNKSIVTQIRTQHPNFEISETHFGNLVSGKRQVNVSLQLAAYICQVFGIENLDFFLDPNIERQRQMILEPVETLRQRLAIYEELERQAAAKGEGVLVALRGVPGQDLATLEQLIALRVKSDEVDLLAYLRALPGDKREILETLRTVQSQDVAALEQLITLHAQTDEVRLLEYLRALPSDQRAAFEQLIRSRAEQDREDSTRQKD